MSRQVNVHIRGDRFAEQQGFHSASEGKRRRRRVELALPRGWAWSAQHGASELHVERQRADPADSLRVVSKRSRSI